MSSVFDKLNLKQQREILVVNAPPSFEPELLALKSVTVLRDPKKAKAIHFALAFATKQAEVDTLSEVLASKAEGDALLRFAYPKGTSKRYKCESTATQVGMQCEVRASIRYAKSLSTKTGRHSASGAWSTSNRPKALLRPSPL
jgi:hypothetical protein